jgi:aspartyl-tRNA(Asn)/glutamyl-tRNA(Gln) amidotransferase subunit B
MVGEGTVSSSAAKEVLEGVLTGEGDPRQVAADRDLIQLSDAAELDSVVDEMLVANPDAVARYQSGEQKVVGFLVGQVMRATQGKADPKIVTELLVAKLGD